MILDLNQKLQQIQSQVKAGTKNLSAREIAELRQNYSDLTQDRQLNGLDQSFWERILNM